LEQRIFMSLDDNVAKDRHRAARPERITIGDDEFVRNDLIAKECGISERTVNRGDKRGAPYVLIGGVKYRPLKRYHQYLVGQIQQRGQTPQRRRRA
jgi:hypothetical protein